MKILLILIYSQSHQDPLKITEVDISVAEAKCGYHKIKILCLGWAVL